MGPQCCLSVYQVNTLSAKIIWYEHPSKSDEIKSKSTDVFINEISTIICWFGFLQHVKLHSVCFYGGNCTWFIARLVCFDRTLKGTTIKGQCIPGCIHTLQSPQIETSSLNTILCHTQNSGGGGGVWIIDKTSWEKWIFKVETNILAKGVWGNLVPSTNTILATHRSLPRNNTPQNSQMWVTLLDAF